MAEYEIWVNAKAVKEASMEELGQMVVSSKITKLFYFEQGNKKVLACFLASYNTTIKDGTLFVKEAITDILYAKVQKYHRLFAYDHVRNKLKYCDDPEELEVRSSTQVLSVLKYPSEELEKVADAIFKK